MEGRMTSEGFAVEDLLLICAPIGVMVYAVAFPVQFASFLNWMAGMFH